MKISTMFMIMIAIQLTIILIGAGEVSLDSSSLTNSSINSGLISQVPEATGLNHLSLLETVLNPTQWEGGLVFAIILAVVALVAVGGSVVGNWLGLKSDLITFAPVLAVFLVWCIPIVSLWRILSNGFGGFMGADAGIIIAGFFVAPLVILCFTTLINWWRVALAEG